MGPLMPCMYCKATLRIEFKYITFRFDLKNLEIYFLLWFKIKIWDSKVRFSIVNTECYDWLSVVNHERTI